MNIDGRQSTVDDVNKSLKRFVTADYVVFIFMLIMCSAVGVYFGYQDHKKQRRNKLKERRGSGEIDYLVGGRSMHVLPVAASLIASGLSGITLLGMPTEIYIYGIHFYFVIIPIFVMGLFVHYVIIPIFHELQIVSTYEYLNLRFNNSVRLFGSLLFLLTNFLWLPIVIYVPALAFNQSTNINVHVISPIVCLVCIFYTLLGGIKAVVWTDFIQIILMYGSIFVILWKGITNIGGLSVLWERNINSTRIEEPIWSIDLTERHSMLALMIGGATFNLNLFGMNQAMVQRYMSLPTVKAARKALKINIIGVIIMISICTLCGLLIHATYYDCDPLTTKLAKAKDQVLPLMVMEILHDVPGLSGLFIAGVFSASLSTLSTALNSSAAVILEDFYKPNSKRKLTESQTRYIMRGTVFVIGAVCVAFVYAVEKLGGVLQLGLSVTGAALGPAFGIFCIGFFLPWIKSKGTLIGAIVGLASSMYVVFRNQTAIASGEIRFETKPVTVEGCLYEFGNVSTPLPGSFIPSEVSFEIHRISYMFFSIFGTIITIVVAFIVSFLIEDHNPLTVDPKLLAPFLRKFFYNPATSNFNGKTTVTHEFTIKDDNKELSDE